MWRRSVNDVLRRTTGYQVQRSTSEGPAVGPERRARRAEAEAQKARAALERTTAQLTAARKDARRLKQRAERASAMPRSYGESTTEIIRRVGERTMTDHRKLFGLIEATRYVVRSEIPGEMVECGVWRGGSMQAVALALLETGSADRQLHLFDTFEGMPPPTDKDRRGDTTAQELLERNDKDHRVWAVAGLDDVREGMAEVGYPEDLVHLHAGMVEDTIPGKAPSRIALLRLDTDWYESTRHELEQLYDRLSPGGVLVLDDYGDWDGARQATDEFVAALGTPLFLSPLGSGRIVVKPGL